MSTAQVRPANKKAPARDLAAGKSNTEIEVSRGNIRIFALPSVGTRLLDEVSRNRFFGFWDTDGVLHPNRHCTQYNWKDQGLFLNVQYLSMGIADVLAVIIKDESYERFLRILDRLSRRPLPVFQGVL